MAALVVPFVPQFKRCQVPVPEVQTWTIPEGSNTTAREPKFGIDVFPK